MTDTRSVTVERELPHPPEKVWRALTTPHFIEEWLMKNDFSAEVGHSFQMSGEWGAVDCEVLDAEEPRSLCYSWNAFGLESTVTWTLTPTPSGTHLKMEQAGFQEGQTQFYQGAKASWPSHVGNLAAFLDRQS
ncbi:SRPBCC family protein [Pseudoroseicyclus tamaricis]|uniref:SRPBCC domain-containing protein n=1 Tax=Pseudoroseicyclus tamaricis TaxID=2705421 RepID=A0A6B2JQF3_9RHOB|nr:SRPBCC domain-containing protein [Pseudoroseicyclus tamaricis]NDV00195.1 SRPBCC domain-containing protein [Pseudoroseicyclus tamaricis]